MKITEKEIRAREAATAYVRNTESKDRTALIALLDAERAKSALMLATLAEFMEQTDAPLTPRGLEDVIQIYRERFRAVIAKAQGESP